MKKHILYIVFTAFISHCFGQKTNKDSLIVQLVELKNSILNSDTEKVCSFFNFPIKNEIIKYTPIADKQKGNINKGLSKRTFIGSYSDIILKRDLVKFFSFINIEELNTKIVSEVVKDTTDKKGTYQSIYTLSGEKRKAEIHIAHKDIIFGNGINDSMSIEWDFMWYFELINGQLKFVKFDTAD